MHMLEQTKQCTTSLCEVNISCIGAKRALRVVQELCVVYVEVEEFGLQARVRR